MHFVAALGQRWKEGWKRATGAILTVVLLSGVAVGGLAMAGSDAFASLKTSEGPLTFDAPTSTLLRLQAKTGSAQTSKELVGDAASLVEDWKYTQLTPAQFQQLQQLLFLFEIVLNQTLLENGLDPENLGMFMNFEMMVFNPMFAQLAPSGTSSGTAFH
ncbi:MAG TPA: hypothetical protein VH682_21850 [Gemmataceae bacterium]|jgi:hypothetical protein